MSMAQKVPTKNPYESKTIIGAVVMLIAYLAQANGYEIGEGEIATVIESAIGLIGAALVIYGRITAKSKVVWTAK